MAEASEPNVQGMQIADVIALISKMGEQNQNALLEAVKELKKPNEFEQIEIEKKLNQLKQKADNHVAFGRIEEQRKQMKVQSCPHARINPATKISFHLWRGQVHTGDQGKPYFMPTCLDCQTQLPKIYCSPEQLTEGVGLNNYNGVDIESLLKWSEMSGNKAEVAEFRSRYKIHREAA